MVDSRRGRGTRGSTDQAVVAGPPMKLVMGAMAIGLFVGALLAPDEATADETVIEAGIAAVERLVSAE